MQIAVVHIFNVLVVWAIFALSLNFLQGTAGLWCLGQAGFFAMGAYAAGLLSKAGVPWIVCMASAALVPVLVAAIYGLPTVRLRPDYFGMVTMGLGEITRHVLNNWQSVTGGPDGLPGIPLPSLFGFQFDRQVGTLVLGLGFLVLTYLALDRWRCSGFGRVLKAAREDNEATKVLGKNTYWFRLKCFVISSAFAGIAGGLYACYYGYIHPGNFGMWVTFNVILTVMLGGYGNYRGTLLGALVFVLLREGLRFLPLPPTTQGPLRQFTYAVLLILIILGFPRGAIPESPSITAVSSGSRKQVGEDGRL